MTILFGNAGFQETSGDVAQAPGAGPVPGAGNQMTGNPASAQSQPFGNLVPAPQVGGVGQTLNAPLVHDTISRGNVPLNAQPTNTVAAAGNAVGADSLLAQIARGQVSLNQSNYGQGGFVPQNGGSSPQAQQPGATNVQTVVTGPGSTLTVAAPANYVGN